MELLFLRLIRPTLEFIVDFFTGITLKRVGGAVILLAGLWVVQYGQSTGDANKLIIYTVAGLIVGGVGAVIIYYDMGKAKIHGQAGFNELETLEKGFDLRAREDAEKKQKDQENPQN